MGGAALMVPLAVEAQQTRVRKVGFLGANTPATAGHWATAFVERLKELGWVEGQTPCHRVPLGCRTDGQV